MKALHLVRKMGGKEEEGGERVLGVGCSGGEGGGG